MAPLPTAERLTRASGRRAWQLRGSGRGGQRMVAAIDAIDTGMRGGPDPDVGDATTFPITIDDEASTGESTVSAWSKDELRTMAETDDVHISPFREDGKTYGTPTWMWSVAVGDAPDVRAYNGKDSRSDQLKADANMTLQKEHNHAQYIEC